MPGPLSATSTQIDAASWRVVMRSWRGPAAFCSACWALTNRLREHLVELIAIGPDRRQIGVELPDHLDVGGAQPVGDDLERRFDRGVDLDRAVLLGLAAGHGEEGPDDARATVRRGADLDRALARLVVGCQLLEQAGVPDHHRERVVELVGDAGEQRAERAHLLVLMEDLALPLELGLDALGLGQVDDRGHHRLAALEGDQLGGEAPPELGAVGPAQADLDAVEIALPPDQRRSSPADRPDRRRSRWCCRRAARAAGCASAPRRAGWRRSPDGCRDRR